MPASARKRPSAYPTSTISARLSASSVSSDLEPWWIILMSVYEDDFMRVFSSGLRSAFSTKNLVSFASEKFRHFHKKSACKTNLYLSLRRWWRRWRRCTNKEDDHKWRWRWWTNNNNNNNNNNKDDDHKKRGASFFLPQTTTTTTITRRRICRLLQCLHLCRAALFSAVVVPGGNRPSP